MLKYLSIAIFVLLTVSCQKTIKVDLSELKQIYYDILSADSLTGKYYLVDSIDNFETNKITQSDTTYFIADCVETRSGVWTDNMYDSLIIVARDRIDSKIQNDGVVMTSANYSFSLPYFSKDKQTLLIYYNHYCGFLCAEYSLRLYKKINGKWTFTKSYFSIVS